MTGDVVTVGAVIGALIGTITFLLKILVASKQQHIDALEDQIREVTRERDLFRDLVLTQRRD